MFVSMMIFKPQDTLLQENPLLIGT